MKGRVWLQDGDLVEELGIQRLVFERDGKLREGDKKEVKRGSGDKKLSWGRVILLQVLYHVTILCFEERGTGSIHHERNLAYHSLFANGARVKP